MAETILAKMAVHIAANTADFKKNLAQSETSLKSFASVTKSVSSSITGYLAGISVGFLVKEMVQATAQFQKFEAVLTNTLGSNSQAQKALKDIQKFATATPFEVNEITAAYVRWANQGLDPNIDKMRQLGDVASSLGAGFEQTAEAFKDLAVGQTKRLEEIGISAEAIRGTDKLALSFKGVNIEIEKNAAGVQKALDTYSALNGVLGTSDQVSKTLGGQLSNLTDAWDQLLLSFGRGNSGIFSGVVKGLTDILNSVTDLVNFANSDPVMERFSEQTSQAVEEFKTFNRELQGNAINQVVQDIQHYQKGLDQLNKFQEVYNANLDKGIEKAIELASTASGEQFDSLEEGVKWAGALTDNITNQEKAVTSLKDQYQQMLKIFQAADPNATKNILPPPGLIESLNTKLKELEEAKIKAFSPEAVARFNDQIKAVREEIDLLNASTANTSGFFKKQLSDAEAGRETQIDDSFATGDPANPFGGAIAGFGKEDLEDSPLVNVRNEIQLTKEQWEDYYATIRDLNEQEIAERQRAMQAALEYGNVIGDTISDVISGQQTFVGAMRKMTAELVKMFFQRAMAGIISSATQTPGPPPVVLAAAAAGIAVISGLFAKIGAGGGRVSGGGGASPSSSRKSSSAELASMKDAQDSNPVIQFVLKGEDIYGSLKNFQNNGKKLKVGG